MTDDIRQKLRDYAREYVLDLDRRMILGQRGEMAGKAFVALQGVLEVTDDWESLTTPEEVLSEVLKAIGTALT